MAALTSTNAQVLYNQGGPDLMAVLALRNITTNDTLDMTTLAIQPAFQVIRKAIIASNASGVAGLAAFAGTVITMPAGLTASSAYLFVTGC
jgi:hypothetical protein